MTAYTRYTRLSHIPRLPLEGRIDLTYRCNSTCRHCWLWLSPRAREQADELSYAEICRIVDEARALGTRRWSISGGEPMLREDFSAIFDYLTHKATGYALNTNGTCITPAIAQLLRRKGTKMIALYGATAEVYDEVTRFPGGFEAAMRGFAYLREAGASFVVQLIPMQANWHQWDEMRALAQRLSPHWRVGAPWLYLSSSGTAATNRAIAAQRLAPHQVIALDPPNLHYEERIRDLGQLDVPARSGEAPTCTDCADAVGDGLADDRLFASCIANRREFHIDAYGRMSWCSFIKDPALRYDLRQGSLREAWEEFIPACADKVRGGDEWRTHCGSCSKRADCRWCGVYAYLETGRYSAPIPYLCAVTEEAGRYKQNWQTNHRRYFRIAGITISLESDLDLRTTRFSDELLAFAVDGPGEDTVTLRHHFELPDLQALDFGRELYRRVPWLISRRPDGTWFYRGIRPDGSDQELHRVAVFSPDHQHGMIYSPPHELEYIHKHGWHALSLFPTDQIWLAPLLAERQAVLIHSGAAIINGQGMLFVGHSEAGKSTTMELLKAASATSADRASLQVEILCDDRNVIRCWPSTDPEHPEPEWRVHGTWSHGTTDEVSPNSAPLRAICFLEQAPDNTIIPLTERKMIWRRLLATLIRSVVTAEWWQHELATLEQVVASIPCYIMRFDKSGAIVPELIKLSEAPSSCVAPL